MMPKAKKQAAKKVAKKKPGRPAKIPEVPSLDPAAGEKTPAYIAWCEKYAPQRLKGKFINWKGKS